MRLGVTKKVSSMNRNEKIHYSQKQAGQGMVEYAILLLLIAAAVILSLTSVGTEIADVFRKINWGGDDTISELITVSVLDAQEDGISGVRVFVYTEEGVYLESYQDTDADGNAMFDLENGRFQFLAHHQLQYYWSPAISRPSQNSTRILTGQAPFTVNVLDISGNGAAEIPVYVYTEEEEYIDITGETDENGILELDLVDSSVKFRVDADDNTQWTDTVPTSDLEITITLNPCSTNQYLAEYFNNRNLNGTPVFTRCESKINNYWGRSGPGNGVNNDNFSVRWTGQFQFEEGAYTFRTISDDGVRVWLDDKNITNAWKPQSATTYTSRQQVEAGIHQVKMEYYERGGYAVARLDWEPVSD